MCGGLSSRFVVLSWDVSVSGMGNNVVYCDVLCYTVLYYTILYYTILYYTILHVETLAGW